MAKWATVTVLDQQGRRHSLDIQADSTFDAAHRYVMYAKEPLWVPQQEKPPIPTLATLFEVRVEGKSYKVKGTDLQEWIKKRTYELGGPRGYLFAKRPTLEE